MFRSAHPTTGKPTYTTRYVYADTTLSTHGGSAGDVRVTGEERTRLQQMADFLERCCNDLDAAGYEVISIVANRQRPHRLHGHQQRAGLSRSRLQRNRWPAGHGTPEKAIGAIMTQTSPMEPFGRSHC